MAEDTPLEFSRLKPLSGIVITALVAVIHRGACVIYQENATPVEPWITGTSPVMTGLGGI